MKKFLAVLAVVAFISGGAGAENSTELGMIVISATKTPQDIADMATNVTVISREEIERFDYADLTEAIESLSEVKVGRNGGIGALSTVAMRGSTASQVLILIDGRVITDHSFGIGIPDQIPLDNVERIEIIKGGGSVLYGANAVGGIINVITRKAVSKEPSIDFGYEYQRYDTQKYRLNFDINRGPASGFFSASRRTSSGFRENENFLGEDIFIKLGYDFDEFGEVTLSGNLYNDDKGIPGRNLTPVDQWGDDLERATSTPNNTQENYKQYGIIEHKLSGIGGFSFKTRLYGNADERKDKYANSASDTVSQNISKGVELQADMPYGITAGVDIRQDRFFQKRYLSNSMLKNSRFTDRAFYAQGKFDLPGRVTLIPGVRFENHSEYTLQTNPKCTAVYRITDSMKLSGNAGRGFRAPTFNELSYNPNIEPEKSLSYDFGGEYSFTDFLNVKTTLYRIDFTELVTWQPDPFGNWLPVNSQGEVRSTGVETAVSHKINKYMSHSANYTYNSTRDRETEKVLFYRPAHKINYSVRMTNNSGTALNISVEGVGRQFTDNIMESSVPGYATADFRLTQVFLSAKVFMGVDNLTNKRYLTRVGYPLPGKIYYAGIKINFLN